jgi:hypothetical protein
MQLLHLGGLDGRSEGPVEPVPAHRIVETAQ